VILVLCDTLYTKTHIASHGDLVSAAAWEGILWKGLLVGLKRSSGSKPGGWNDRVVSIFLAEGMD
jgi:hypothetical protein